MKLRLASLLFPVIAGCYLLVALSYAQTTVSLRGQVTDQIYADIPAAQVTIVAADGKKQSTQTTTEGEFSFLNLSPGSYTLIVEAKGFRTYTQKEFALRSDSPPLKIVLTIASLREEQTVPETTPLVFLEPQQNLSATLLEGKVLTEILPDNVTDLQELTQAPASPGSPGVVTSGQDGSNVYVNGFRSGRVQPKETLERIHIGQNPYAAEYAEAGRREFLTKSSRDQWRGSFVATVRHSALDTRNAFALTKPEVTQQKYGVSLGGPLFAPKLFVFGYWEHMNSTGASTTNWIDLNDLQTRNVFAPNANTSLSLRADYLVNSKNTLSLVYFRAQRNSQSEEFSLLFGGGFGFADRFAGSGSQIGNVNFLRPERGTDSKASTHDWQLFYTTIISSRFVNEARLRLGYDQGSTQARTPGVSINVLDAFNGGGSATGSGSSHRFDYEWQEYLTYTVQRHTLKGGWQTRYLKPYSYSQSNFNGTYIFPSLDYYHCITSGITGCVTSGRGIYQFTVNTGNPRWQYSQVESSWFFNDDVRLHRNFMLSFGVRHEFQTHLQDRNNWAPRFSLAWSPWANHKTVFRAGAGIFYQRLTNSWYAPTIRFNGQTQLSYLIASPEKFLPNFKLGDPLPRSCDFNGQNCRESAALAANTTQYILDPQLQAPYTWQTNFSVARQLPWGLAGTVELNYGRGIHLFRLRNINAPRLELLAAPTADINSTRPNPTQGNILQTEASARSEWKTLFVGVNRRLGRRAIFSANYSLTEGKSDAGGLPANNYDLRGEWGPIAHRHQVFLMGRISLPRGLHVSPVLLLRSGDPFNITLGQDLNRDNDFNDRPAGINRNSDLPASRYLQVVGCRSGRLNPATGACGGGQSLAGFLRQTYPNGVKAIGPGANNLNVNVGKTFRLGRGKATSFGGNGNPPGSRDHLSSSRSGAEAGRYTLQLSAQVTNIFNHVNFGQYTGTLTSPYFYASNNAAPGRQFEMNVRLSF